MLDKNSFSVLLATLVKSAASLRELSYDHAASDAATRKRDAEEEQFRIDRPGEIFYGCVDYKEFYQISLEEACEKVATDAGHPGLTYPLYLLLNQTWNDISSWAEDVLDPKATVEPCFQHCQHGVAYPIPPKPEDEKEEPIEMSRHQCELCEERLEEIQAQIRHTEPD